MCFMKSVLYSVGSRIAWWKKWNHHCAILWYYVSKLCIAVKTVVIFPAPILLSLILDRDSAPIELPFCFGSWNIFVTGAAASAAVNYNHFRHAWKIGKRREQGWCRINVFVVDGHDAPFFLISLVVAWRFVFWCCYWWSYCSTAAGRFRPTGARCSSFTLLITFDLVLVRPGYRLLFSLCRWFLFNRSRSVHWL